MGESGLHTSVNPDQSFSCNDIMCDCNTFIFQTLGAPSVCIKPPLQGHAETIDNFTKVFCQAWVALPVLGSHSARGAVVGCLKKLGTPGSVCACVCVCFFGTTLDVDASPGAGIFVVATSCEVIVTLLDYQMKYQLDSTFSKPEDISYYMASFGQWCAFHIFIQC